MSDNDQIRAWNKRTGQWQQIPAHWLDHPVFGADFAAEPPAPAPKTKEK